MKTTRYFDEQVLRKRPYIRRDWCEDAVHASDAKVRQLDSRMRSWKFIPESGSYLRVVTLEDGETLHNAFPDRDIRGLV